MPLSLLLGIYALACVRSSGQLYCSVPVHMKLVCNQAHVFTENLKSVHFLDG